MNEYGFLHFTTNGLRKSTVAGGRRSTGALGRSSRRSLGISIDDGARALRVIVLAGLLLAGVACGASSEVREDTFTVGDSPRLVVRSESGQIIVTTGPDNAIRVMATLRRPSWLTYQTSQSGDTVTIDVEDEGGFPLFALGRSPGADLEVTVPFATRVDLRNSNGNIEVQGVHESGAITSSNGKIVLQSVTGDFRIRTSNGSVTIRQSEGSFDVETSNGSISFSGSMAPGGHNRLMTSNGSVSVALETEPSVAVDASTSNGSISTTLPILTTTKGSGSRLIGTIGGGEADLTIRTSNGSVTITGP